MNEILCIFLLACTVLLGGCSRSRQFPENVVPESKQPQGSETQITTEYVPEKELPEVIQIPVEGLVKPPKMIKVHKLTLSDKTMVLDYQVWNRFEDDILVCIDGGLYGKRDAYYATTRIANETVRIELRSNIERGTSTAYLDRPIAKYVRLAPGETYSGRVFLELPVKDYSHELWRDGKKHNEITLCHCVFEVGYLASQWIRYFHSASEINKKETTKLEPMCKNYYYDLAYTPFVTEQTLDGRLREVVYTKYVNASTINEEFAEVVLTDIAIPCSVVVGEEY